MSKNSKIYIAGHQGLVGSAIVKILRLKGFNNIIGRTRDELELTNQEKVQYFFMTERPEYVVLAAAKVGGIFANNTLRADFIYDNLAIQTNVINSAWRAGVKKLIFLGSTCIYPKDAPQPLKEGSFLSSKLEYTNEPYAIAKIAGIKMCESYNIQYKTNFISVMPTNLYGKGDNYDLEKSHVLPALIRKFHLGKCLEQNQWDLIRKDLDKNPVENISGRNSEEEIEAVLNRYGILTEPTIPGKDVTITIWGTGKPLREFMYSEDLAEACVFILEKIDIEDILSAHNLKPHELEDNPPHFINIGTGVEISIKNLAEKIKDITGFRGKIVYDPSKPDGTMRKITDVSIMDRFGFRAKTTLEEGLRITYMEYVNEIELLHGS